MLVRSWVPFKQGDPKYLFLSIVWILLGIVVFFLFLNNEPEIIVEWQTETEFNTIGFNIWRRSERSESYQKINESIIPSSSDPVSGESYSYKDIGVEAGSIYYYQLEDIDQDGSSTRHDEISIEVPRTNTLLLFFVASSIIFGLILGIRGLNPDNSRDNGSKEHGI